MLTPQEEQEVLSAARMVPRINDALMGTLDGKQKGALHMVEDMFEDIYDEDEGLKPAVKKLQDARQRLLGILFALNGIVAIIGVLDIIVRWREGK